MLNSLFAQFSDTLLAVYSIQSSFFFIQSPFHLRRECVYTKHKWTHLCGALGFSLSHWNDDVLKHLFNDSAFDSPIKLLVLFIQPHFIWLHNSELEGDMRLCNGIYRRLWQRYSRNFKSCSFLKLKKKTITSTTVKICFESKPSFASVYTRSKTIFPYDWRVSWIGSHNHLQAFILLLWIFYDTLKQNASQTQF